MITISRFGSKLKFSMTLLLLRIQMAISLFFVDFKFKKIIMIQILFCTW
jgi:hypothetical protein